MLRIIATVLLLLLCLLAGVYDLLHTWPVVAGLLLFGVILAFWPAREDP
ncbi:hypothetical protein [Deinococcus sonorensis]|uniref:DUF4175 domain-containing protein n=1 Tax=Deinococcus sonorensis TaxID=309891 RepID=A0ABV8YBC2_9DEIO